MYQPKQISASQSDNVYLYCNVTVAHPDATIQWYRDGRVISSRGDMGVQVTRTTNLDSLGLLADFEVTWLRSGTNNIGLVSRRPSHSGG